MTAGAWRFSCGDMQRQSSALGQAGMPISNREFWLGDQIDGRASIAEYLVNLKQVRFRAHGEHGLDGPQFARRREGCEPEREQAWRRG